MYNLLSCENSYCDEFILSLGLIFISSLSGSFHCAGMCGGFSCIVCTKDQNKLPIFSIISYHLGRLTTYLTLSLIMYSSTSLLQRISKSNFIIYTTLIVCIFLLLIDIWKDFSKNFSLVSLGKSDSIFSKIINKLSILIGLQFDSKKWQSSLVRSGIIGILTGLIPCGWLYIYIAIAGTQSNILNASLIITSFWLGTIPALLIVGLLGAKISDNIFPKIRYISRSLLIVVALISIHLRFPFFSDLDKNDCSFCITEEKK